MPRRATLTYSSEDAPQLGGEQLYVYYCKYSGKHALTTDCDLNRAPKRRADHASVIDTSLYTIKLYTADGGVKLLRRKDGTLERQYRYNVGKLPVAYKTEPEGRYLYILDGALSAFSVQDRVGGDKPPVPPCIMPLDKNTVQVALEVDDRAQDVACLLKISADYIRLQITNPISNEHAMEEMLELMRSVLGVKLAQLSIKRGESARHKLLLVEGSTPSTVFERMQSALSRQSS